MKASVVGRAFDLVIAGGRVLDPATGRDELADVAVANGRIAAISPGLAEYAISPRPTYPPHPGTQVIDASGLLVTPGLIDLHAHVYTGVCPLTVPADEVAMLTGVTTIVSAGDAGAHTIEGFRSLVVNASRTRVLAYLNISAIGLAGWPVGEAINLDHLDVGAAIDAVELNRDLVCGIKVRQSAPEIVGNHGLEPLRRARRVGDHCGIPVMVHIGEAPRPLRDLLEQMAPGDIVTHCYTGSGNGLVVDGLLIPEAIEARHRGILFDVGHGYGSFDYLSAEVCVAKGFFPDCISSDIHSLSANGPAHDLPTTMSKFLALGMPLVDVIAATTATPARVLLREDTIGSVQVGRVADIAVLQLRDDVHVEFADAFGHKRTSHEMLDVRHTVRAGLPWLRPWPHPGRSLAAPGM